jgi:hypothetical protein
LKEVEKKRAEELEKQKKNIEKSYPVYTRM